MSLGNIKHTHTHIHTHTRSLTCGVALGCAITSDRSDLRSTYLLIATSLFHSTVLSLSLSLSLTVSLPRSLVCSLSLSVAHTDARDSAATRELSPSSLYVTERGRVPSDLPPAHATRPNTPLLSSPLLLPPSSSFSTVRTLSTSKCTEKENASIE